MGAAVDQEVRERLSGNRKVAGSIPGLLPLLAKCGGDPEQDTT